MVNSQPRLRRTVAIIEWLIIASMAIYLCGRTLPRAWQTLNTDFPNYYLTALLSEEGQDATRVYEWLWIQRQKDHREINQPVVGLVPITPFSTLMVRPLTRLSPLTAKRVWILLNGCLLIVVCVLLRSVTRMKWREIALVAALNVSLHRNFLYGQYYVLLLFIVVLACWCYQRGRRVESGLLIGISAGVKMFPILYVLYFMRKRDVKALVGGMVGIGVAAIVSLMAFGWELNRLYLVQVLPWALRGEGLNPYNVTNSSIASLLHRLFIYEPQWNPHPVAHIPWMFAIVHPLLQVVIVGVVVLLVSPGSNILRGVEAEWAAMLLAMLAISTMPASYVFTLMIFPICVLWRELSAEGRRMEVLVLFVLYLIVEVPVWNSLQGVGWYALLGCPRLYALIAICVLSCLIMWRKKERGVGHSELIWVGLMIGCMGYGIVSGLRHQHGLYADYFSRIPMTVDALLESHPVQGEDGTFVIAMLRGGYRVGTVEAGSAAFVNGAMDQLGVSVAGSGRWIEAVGKQSNIVNANSGHVEVPEAESPVVTSDGTRMAFLREDSGRSQLWIHEMGEREADDNPLSPAGANVYEMAFLKNDELIVAADIGSMGPGLYAIDIKRKISPLVAARARYPAVSPDRKWLAYSRLDRGYWNLWIREIGKDREIRITNVECNGIEPTWEKDSKTLIYASDCGRALWFTALSRRRVVP